MHCLIFNKNRKYLFDINKSVFLKNIPYPKFRKRKKSFMIQANFHVESNF